MNWRFRSVYELSDPFLDFTLDEVKERPRMVFLMLANGGVCAFRLDFTPTLN